jgi:hypothetical protein
MIGQGMDGPLQIDRLGFTPASYGLVVQFVSTYDPFRTFEFGRTATALMHQLEFGHHLVAAQQDQIVGYLGWLPTTSEIADAWVHADGPLNGGVGDAVAVTILCADKPAVIPALIRRAKQVNPDVSVFWKRYFVDGRPPTSRVVRKRTER